MFLEVITTWLGWMGEQLHTVCYLGTFRQLILGIIIWPGWLGEQLRIVRHPEIFRDILSRKRFGWADWGNNCALFLVQEYAGMFLEEMII